MRLLLQFLLIFGMIGGVLLALGIGIGFLLHWLIPAVDLGVGMLTGVLTVGFTAMFFGRISSMPLDDYDADDEPMIVETPIAQRVTYLIDPAPPRRRRKRK